MDLKVESKDNLPINICVGKYSLTHRLFRARLGTGIAHSPTGNGYSLVISHKLKIVFMCLTDSLNLPI